MKKILYILALLALTSCYKHEGVFDEKTMYPFEPEQSTMIKVDVVPVGDIELEFEDMNLEVNADYFNRYGIGVELIVKDRIPHPKENEYLQYGDYGQIILYVVDISYINFSGVAAYTARMTNNTGTKTIIVLGDKFQTSGTLAHELGHALSLNHVDIKNNIMSIGSRAGQYWTPNDFVPEQIDTMMLNMDRYSGKQFDGFGEKETIIID